MFSSEDVAQSIEEFARNKSYTRFKNRLPRMKEQDIHAAFYYALHNLETEFLSVIVQNASNLSEDQIQKALLYLVGHENPEKITELLSAHPKTNTSDAMNMAGKASLFGSIKVLLPHANTHSIDRAFESSMKNGEFGLAKFLMPHISEDGDHVNSLIYASDAHRQDIFDFLYTIPRAQQAFKKIHLLSEGMWGEGYNIKPIKDRLEMDLQKQRIHAQIGPMKKSTATRKI